MTNNENAPTLNEITQSSSNSSKRATGMRRKRVQVNNGSAAVTNLTAASAAASQPVASSQQPASPASGEVLAEQRAETALPEDVASGSSSGAAPTSTTKLISVERIEGTNGKSATFIAKVVEKASSVLGLNKTPNALPANSTLISRNGKGEAAAPAASKGGRRKRRTHRKRTHKSHKRSHKSHRRIHR